MCHNTEYTCTNQNIDSPLCIHTKTTLSKGSTDQFDPIRFHFDFHNALHNMENQKEIMDILGRLDHYTYEVILQSELVSLSTF